MSKSITPQENTSQIHNLRLKVKTEGYARLNAAAIEVNRCWNYANEINVQAARSSPGTPVCLSVSELNELTAGLCKEFQHISSVTMECVNARYATRCQLAQKVKLRWRKSYGRHSSLGWVPFTPEQIEYGPRSLRFMGKALRVFEFDKLSACRLKSGSFAQDARGVWWLCAVLEGSWQSRRASPTDLASQSTCAENNT